MIYADPPWNFKTWSNKGRGRTADAWYDLMNLEDIKNLSIVDSAAKDCVLLLWAIDSMLPQAFDVIKSWGFEYKTVGFYWAKTTKSGGFFMGLGHWTRTNPEICLLATRGKPKRLSAAVRKLVVSPRREHSRKPDEVYERIETLLQGPYLELFARQQRVGWDVWGNQTSLFNDSLPKRRWKADMRECA